MACLLMHRSCKACGEAHDFYLREGELVTEQRYEYHCPVTGRTGFLWDIPRVKAVDQPPAGGVELRPTHEESDRSTK